MNETEKTMQNIRMDFLRFECPSTGLISIATTKNLGDPRREIARQIIQEMYEQVFDSQESFEPTCNIHGTIPYSHGYCPFCK